MGQHWRWVSWAASESKLATGLAIEEEDRK